MLSGRGGEEMRGRRPCRIEFERIVSKVTLETLKQFPEYFKHIREFNELYCIPFFFACS